MNAVVAVPVRNEREHVAACLAAFDAQTGLDAGALGIVLFLNNCDDGTADVVEALGPGLRWPIRVVERQHLGATAGWARREAMEAAAAWLDETGDAESIILTTDADSRVPPDWVSRNLAALRAGADAVAGRLALDEVDAALLPAALHARGRVEAAYEDLVTETAALIDPAPGNPWPTHRCCSGASLATRLRTYRDVGGMPSMEAGEDRAFVEAVLAFDGVVRHDPDMVVTTSARRIGRAAGGTADTLRRRSDDPDSACDDGLERYGRVVARALLRRRLRWLHAAGRHDALHRWTRRLVRDPKVAAHVARLPNAGAMLAALKSASADLAYRPLRPRELSRQIRRARLFLPLLRLLRSTPGLTPVGERQPFRLTADRTAVEACD